MATLTGEITKVRALLDQTDNTDTQFSDTMIGNLLNQGRRLFARILPQEMIPGLKTTASITLTSGAGAFPSTFLRHVEDGQQLVDSVQAREIPPGERWRLKFLSANDLIKGGTTDKYYFWHTTGVLVYPTTASAMTFQFIKKPTDLSGTDSTELPPDVDDMVVDFAFYKCMNTQRGDMDIAAMIAKERGFHLQGAKV